MENSRKILAENVKRLKESRKVSEQNIADRGGPSQRTVNRAKNGENVTLENLDKIANYFRIPAWQLLVPGMDIGTGINSPPPGVDEKTDLLIRRYEAAPPAIKRGVEALLAQSRKRRKGRRTNDL